MKSKSKKLTSVLLIVATIISTCAISVFTAYAYPDVPIKEVELYPDQSFTYSPSKMGRTCTTRAKTFQAIIAMYILTLHFITVIQESGLQIIPLDLLKATNMVKL